MPQLAEARRARGWSQAQLAERSGASRSAVQRLENGRGRVGVRTAQALAAALDLDASTIYELQPILGLTAVGETGSGEAARTGDGTPGRTP